VAVLFLGCSRYANDEDLRGHSLVTALGAYASTYSFRILKTPFQSPIHGMIVDAIKAAFGSSD
jgi:hypothetical protein